MEEQTFCKVEESIVIVRFKRGITIDLYIAKEIVKQRLEYFNGESYPCIVDIRAIEMITKEARDYFAKGDAIKGIPAGALLVESYVTKLISNLFIRFSRPSMPTKAFTSEEEAIKWLKQFVNQ
jgi:hypothetical protein